MKKRIVAAVVLGLSMGMLPSQTQANDLDPWAEFLRDVDKATQRLMDSPGIRVELHDGEVVEVDMTTGYARKADGRLVDWTGADYEPLGQDREVQSALRLLGKPPGTWAYSPSSGDRWPWIEMPLLNVVAQYSKAAWTPTKSISGDAVSYSLRNAKGAQRTVDILSDGVRIVQPYDKVVWRTSAARVDAPDVESLVSSTDLSNASAAIRMKDGVRKLIRWVRIDGLTRRGALRLIRQQASRTRLFRYRRTDTGVVLTVHNPYLHSQWRLAWVGSGARLRVRSKDLHPAGWTPALTPVEVRPETPVTSTGREAIARVNQSLIWAHAQHTTRVNLTFLNEGSIVFALRMADDAIAVLDPDGQPAVVAGIRGKQCYRLPSARSARLKAALLMTGRPNATWSCESSGDDWLAWLPMYGPFGFLIPWSRLLFDPALVANTAGQAATYELDTDWGNMVLAFTGDALAQQRFDRFGEDPQGVLEMRYSYEPLTFRLPPTAERVSDYLLDQARLSLRARVLVRKAAVRARDCMREHVARGRSARRARTVCLDEFRMSGGDVDFRAVPGGIQASLVTEFSIDRRSAVWDPSRHAVVIADVVHRARG